MNHVPKRILTISIVLLNLFIDNYCSADPGDVEKYLQAGTKLLAAGQLVDALAQYDKAQEGDPDNYLIYYRRATVFLALGRTKSAVEDLSSSLKFNSGFNPARSQRANLYLKQGKLSDAKSDIKFLLTKTPDDSDALKILQTIDIIANEIESAKSYYSNKRYNETIIHLDKAIEVTTLNHDLREMRANCYLKLGDKTKAIQDFRHTVKLATDDRDGILYLSNLLYENGEAEQSLLEIRECLKLDPDHKECFKHYKNVKKLVQLLNAIQEASKENRFDDCISKAKKLKDNEFYTNFANQYLCTCHAKGGDTKIAVEVCLDAHNFEPTNLDTLCDLSDAYIANEDYDSAIRYYQKVLEVDRSHKRAKDGVNKAQKLLKNSKKRNYYKILGVSRTASKKEILKAYRKLAAEYHPDHYKGANKQSAERMFIDITDAKDVLTDPEKRSKYDNGEDPLDPEQQYQGPTGNPFGGFTFHNFNPFEHQGGGFQYEFHFG